jgi:hypothetical protein
VKNDLNQREDVRGIIQRPIWSRFGIRRPSIALGNEVQACQIAFNTICTYIDTRDLVQEHIAYKVWPLANKWEMPKEATAGSSQSVLVYLKYTFWFINQFDEPNDDWLDAIEATSDELLGAYSRAEDEAMTVTFGARRKKRLNRMFDVIGFVYLDYCFPVQRQGRKRKVTTSTSSSALKAKKVKVLTHRPKRIKMADVPKLIEKAKTAPLATKTAPAMPMKAIADPAKESELEKVAEQPKIPVIALTKLPATTTATPRKRRMASVLDALLESMKMPPPTSAEASGEKIEDAREMVAASTSSAHDEAGPSEAVPEKLVEESLPKKPTTFVPKAPP